MKEMFTPFTHGQAEKLDQLAKKHGKTTEEFFAEIVVRELKKRNKPGIPKGNIRAFRRP
ncbi:hypothetical protein [uncultured Microbulbifer sp.]|uniref:hypothetical protein n=1 Tax=uncultured Microbulbifer sp. TaxID=348147 RepID=UPI00261E7D05|nr:hypothetical protein [uncultured Microbulbifer sp.]